MYGYPYYGQPMPDQLAQLRQNQMMQNQLYQNQMQQNPMMQTPMAQPQQMAQQMPQQSGAITWVQGEAAAKSFPVANGATVTLWDSERQTIYIKSVDITGKPDDMRIIDYVERPRTAQGAVSIPAQEYVTREEFAALAARVEEYNSKKSKKKETEEVENA